MTTELPFLMDAASYGVSLADVAKLGGALLLGALLGWDISARNETASARRRQGALALLTFLSALGVVAAMRGGAGLLAGAAPAVAFIVPLSAAALLILAATAVRVLLSPVVGAQTSARDTVFSMGFALALGLACGAGLAHVAIVIVPAALLFLNLMRWTPPQTSPTAIAAPNRA